MRLRDGDNLSSRPLQRMDLALLVNTSQTLKSERSLSTLPKPSNLMSKIAQAYGT
ncbi:hypothetical protein [Calothrix sp. NIES-2098]|uniref:hypothetical protein n=1 Tax=Calothrix sp. NIES-2098 TaxID=1954171 RepID=UPI000B5F84A1|nr:hypothetical protein NIES2098_20280 [Calothrix sp. NIES-2098]